MSTKDALGKMKEEANNKPVVKAPEKQPQAVESFAPKSDTLPEITTEQLHNMAKNLHAVMKVVALHQKMHNEHYKTHKDHGDKIAGHDESHDLSHRAISKLIDASKGNV